MTCITEMATPSKLSKSDLAVVIDTTIAAMVADGSRTFLAGTIAREIKKSGYYVYAPEIGKYLSQHPSFSPVCASNKHLRWQLVGEL